eukprot:1146199-Pelagomonas_calceolata.AAC.8
MDIFCVAGTVEQAEQPHYLAEGQITCNLVTLYKIGAKSAPIITLIQVWNQTWNKSKKTCGLENHAA